MKKAMNVAMKAMGIFMVGIVSLLIGCIITLALANGNGITENFTAAERGLSNILSAHASSIEKSVEEAERNKKHNEWVKSEYERRLQKIDDEYDKKLNELNDWVASQR